MCLHLVSLQHAAKMHHPIMPAPPQFLLDVAGEGINLDMHKVENHHGGDGAAGGEDQVDRIELKAWHCVSILFLISVMHSCVVNSLDGLKVASLQDFEK